MIPLSKVVRINVLSQEGPMVVRPQVSNGASDWADHTRKKRTRCEDATQLGCPGGEDLGLFQV